MLFLDVNDLIKGRDDLGGEHEADRARGFLGEVGVRLKREREGHVAAVQKILFARDLYLDLAVPYQQKLQLVMKVVIAVYVLTIGGIGCDAF